MRVSTTQMFSQNTNNILNTQSDVNKATQQIASGKRVDVSGDDPVAAIGIDNLKQKNTLADQYIRNIDYANNHLSIVESSLGGAEDLVMSMRDLTIRSMNGALSGNDRQTIADEMRSSLEELLSVANGKDESGKYTFAGFKTDTQPFAFDNSGNIVYQGDTNARTTGVANGVSIETNIPGDQVFMNASNPLGDFSVNYLPGQTGEMQVKGANITNSGAHTVVAPEKYTFNFTDNGAGGVQLEVIDSGANSLVTVPSFDPATPVSFNGIEVNIAGSPANGDSFTMEPQTQVSIFDTFSQAISIIEDESRLNSPQGHSELAQILDDIESGFNQIGTTRGLTGNKLNSLDNYKTAHEDEKIVNSSALSMLEDLDYAEAIAEFEKQQIALNAVSQVFSRVNSTSLFDYI